MQCEWIKRRLLRYVEFDLGPVERLMVRLHLTRCSECHALYEQSEALDTLIAAPPAPPPGLEIRILSALSFETLRRRQPGFRWRSLRVRLGNLVRPVAVPAVGGMLVALVLLPAFLSAFWFEPTAHAEDIPLRFLAEPLVTAPVMALPSPYPVGRDFTVLAYIDERGGVYDYRVAGGQPLDKRTRGELASALVTSRFEPAQRFGRPILGQRVILFQRIDSRV